MRQSRFQHLGSFFLVICLLLLGTLDATTAYEPTVSQNTIPNEPPSGSGFNPYIVAIPGSGLSSSPLFVSASRLSQQAAPVYVNADQGPTSHKHSYSMTYDGDQTYHYNLDNFFTDPRSVSGSIEITTTTSTTTTTILSTGLRHYERWPVLRDESAQLSTENGAMQLWLDPETLPANLTYLLAVETIAPVDEPSGWRGMSTAYSISASGAIGQADRPYLLVLKYNSENLGGSDPQTLSIFHFDSTTSEWLELGGNVHVDRKDVVLSTRNFGTFRLFVRQNAISTPTPTSTPTQTETPSPTPTHTSTAIPTPTPTPSSTPTFTLTPTSTPTQTETPSPTPTHTSTATPTSTSTPSSTPTSTATVISIPKKQVYVPLILK